MNSPTLQFHKTNLEVALTLWAKVPPEAVVPGLADWVCGTQACFGGRVAQWPHFQRLGVWATPETGAPCIPLHYKYHHPDISGYLFGDRSLMSGRNWHDADEDNNDLTDHEIVTARLNYALERVKELQAYQPHTTATPGAST